MRLSEVHMSHTPILPHKRVYAMYKGDECLAIGTRQEIATKLNMTLDHVKWCGTPTAAKRNKGGKRKLLIPVDD